MIISIGVVFGTFTYVVDMPIGKRNWSYEFGIVNQAHFTTDAKRPTHHKKARDGLLTRKPEPKI